MTGNCLECEKNKLLGKPLQRKLAISEPSDQYEQEADRVAAQVMQMPQMPDTDFHGSRRPNWDPLVQRQATNGATGVIEVPPIVHDVLNSPGQPLDAATRAFFEPRFGHDFSRVRVHTDAQAAESARSVNAQAYTVGHDVVMGHSAVDRGLLGHELAHVVQQGHGSTASSVQAQTEAHSAAERVAHGDAVSAKNLSGAPHGLYRDVDDKKKPEDAGSASQLPPMPNLQLQTLPPIDWLKMRKSFDVHGDRLSLRDADDMAREWERSSAILDTLGINDRFKLWFITKNWILNKGVSMQLDDRFARENPNSWDRFNRDWKNANPGMWETPIFPIFDIDWIRGSQKKKK